MKVAFINPPWGLLRPPIDTGGSVPLILYQLARQISRRAQVLFYVRGGFLPEEVIHEDIRFRYIPVAADKLLQNLWLTPTRSFRHRRKPLFQSAMYYVGYALSVAADVRHRGCDVVHIANFSQFVPIIRAFNGGAKIVLHMHCEDLTRIHRHWGESRIAQCDLVLGCSKQITDKIRRAFPRYADRCQTLCNGVDTELFQPAADAQKSPPTVLFVGRVAPEKGVHVLIEAFNRLAQVRRDVHLNIVGTIESGAGLEFIVKLSDEPQVQALAPLFRDYRQQLLSRLDPAVADRVHFVGEISHRATVSHYQRASVLALPSVFEAFGVPTIEAMSCGLPVVASNGCAFPDIIDNQRTGLLVPMNDPAALADALDKVLGDPARSRDMGAAGRARAQRIYDWNVLGRELMDYYESLMQTAPAMAVLV